MSDNIWKTEFEKLNIYNFNTHTFNNDINIDKLHDYINNNEMIYNFYTKKQNYTECEQIVRIFPNMILFVKNKDMKELEYFSLCQMAIRKDSSLLLFINPKNIGTEIYCKLCNYAVEFFTKSFKSKSCHCISPLPLGICR